MVIFGEFPRWLAVRMGEKKKPAVACRYCLVMILLSVSRMLDGFFFVFDRLFGVVYAW